MSLSTDTRHEHCALEDKDSVLCSTLEDPSRVQSLLSQCQGDLSHPKGALGHGAAVARTRGDTYSHVSSQLEVNTLKRDVDRLEDKLSHRRKDVGDREHKTHDLDPCNRAAWSWIRSGGLPNIFGASERSFGNAIIGDITVRSCSCVPFYQNNPGRCSRLWPATVAGISTKDPGILEPADTTLVHNYVSTYVSNAAQSSATVTELLLMGQQRSV